MIQAVNMDSHNEHIQIAHDTEKLQLLGDASKAVLKQKCSQLSLKNACLWGKKECLDNSKLKTNPSTNLAH